MRALIDSLVNLASLRRRAIGDIWAHCHRLRAALAIAKAVLYFLCRGVFKGAGTGMSRSQAGHRCCGFF